MATKKAKSKYDDLTPRSNLPSKNALEQKIGANRAYAAFKKKLHAGPTRRYARGKVKK